MENSQELGELLSALSIAQGQLDNVKKGKDGHNYKYADLSMLINLCKPILSDNGLSVIQLLEDGGLRTILGHKSGQYISSLTALPNAVLAGAGGKNPVQQAGSAITYMRRYSYAAILGVAQTDDDASGYIDPIELITEAVAKNDHDWLLGLGKEVVRANWGRLPDVLKNQLKAISEGKK